MKLQFISIRHQPVIQILHRIKKAIIDKENVIPPGTEIGINPQKDRERFPVTPRGIVVVPKGYFGGR